MGIPATIWSTGAHGLTDLETPSLPREGKLQSDLDPGVATLPKCNTSLSIKMGKKRAALIITHLWSNFLILNYLGEFTFSLFFFLFSRSYLIRGMIANFKCTFTYLKIPVSPNFFPIKAWQRTLAWIGETPFPSQLLLFVSVFVEHGFCWLI